MAVGTLQTESYFSVRSSEHKVIKKIQINKQGEFRTKEVENM